MFVWGRVARRAAVDFQRHVTQLQGRSISLVSIYGRAFRQFWEFGVSIVDKVVSWREGIPLEQFTWEGRDEVKALLAQGQGVIFLGAHVGNIEVIRAFGETRRVVINALMFTGNSPRIRAFLEEINDKSFLRVIDLSAMDPSMVFDLQERLDRGEIVALLGDRATKHSVGRVVEVPFMGRMAQFPEGPWILASLLDAPVYTVFSMRERGNRYRVEFSRLADRISLPRATRKAALQGYISQFASRLEEIVRRYPFQWFNFYPFWTEEERAEELAPCSEQGVAAPGS
jgi:predicted LPLAT superfamily acyltransferase